MDTNPKIHKPLLYPELSYKVGGILFRVHNEIGGFAREKQYADLLEQFLKEANIRYRRECVVGESGNIIDFVIEDSIVIELKAKRAIVKEDYVQVQRYLQESQLRLGLLVNFRTKYLKPIRIVRIDTHTSAY